MRSNRDYDYFGNVLEYEYDYFALHTSTSTITQKVLILWVQVQSTITPSLTGCLILFSYFVKLIIIFTVGK